LDSTSFVKDEAGIPCWVEEQQIVSTLPASVAKSITKAGSPLIPFDAIKAKVILPLSSDHLIFLIQFNVLRASITNRHIISRFNPQTPDECSTRAGPCILPDPECPQDLPQSLMPTELQRTVPHEQWIDIVPHPQWRDNLILASGTFDEDELWIDCIGGLFEGFPASTIETNGIIAWSQPWHASGWEISEGFIKKWGWLLTDCEEIVDISNGWRRKRGERPLKFPIDVTNRWPRGINLN
jgi:hypothetical protein